MVGPSPPPPVLVVGPLTKELFCGFPNVHTGKRDENKLFASCTGGGVIPILTTEQIPITLGTLLLAHLYHEIFNLTGWDLKMFYSIKKNGFNKFSMIFLENINIIDRIFVVE